MFLFGTLILLNQISCFIKINGLWVSHDVAVESQITILQERYLILFEIGQILKKCEEHLF